MKVCTIDGCEKGGRIVRGWCRMHHERWRRHGDPLGAAYRGPEATFLAKTEPIVGDPGCLIWTGVLDGGGYGQLSVNGRKMHAHRYAWQRVNGPIPDGTVTDHTCWNRACCNVEHLRLATRQQNRQNLSGAHSGRKHDLPRGVYRNGRGYQAMVGHNGQRYWLGTFSTPEEASAAAQAKRALLFGAYAGGA